MHLFQIRFTASTVVGTMLLLGLVFNVASKKAGRKNNNLERVKEDNHKEEITGRSFSYAKPMVFNYFQKSMSYKYINW
jgi:hypothetical protein